MLILGTDIKRGDLIVITMKDSEIFRGVFFDYDYAGDTVSGVDEICIRDTMPSRSLAIRDIDKICKVA